MSEFNYNNFVEQHRAFRKEVARIATIIDKTQNEYSAAKVESFDWENVTFYFTTDFEAVFRSEKTDFFKNTLVTNQYRIPHYLFGLLEEEIVRLTKLDSTNNRHVDSDGVLIGNK
ncbi:MAG TPA: hypothetical protein PLP33_25365 [Leptospiraceae bacterium]|nr:hypothetical protein [Leptospiraceae bacterium]